MGSFLPSPPQKYATELTAVEKKRRDDEETAAQRKAKKSSILSKRPWYAKITDKEAREATLAENKPGGSSGNAGRAGRGKHAAEASGSAEDQDGDGAKQAGEGGPGVQFASEDEDMTISSASDESEEEDEEASDEEREETPATLLAAALMERCDGAGGTSNGEITENEIRTGLLTTGYRLFMDWITAGRPSRFKQIDKDKSGSIGRTELIYCCEYFLKEFPNWEPEKKKKLDNRKGKGTFGMHHRRPSQRARVLARSLQPADVHIERFAVPPIAAPTSKATSLWRVNHRDRRDCVDHSDIGRKLLPSERRELHGVSGGGSPSTHASGAKTYRGVPSAYSNQLKAAIKAARQPSPPQTARTGSTSPNRLGTAKRGVTRGSQGTQVGRQESVPWTPSSAVSHDGMVRWRGPSAGAGGNMVLDNRPLPVRNHLADATIPSLKTPMVLCDNVPHLLRGIPRWDILYDEYAAADRIAHIDKLRRAKRAARSKRTGRRGSVTTDQTGGSSVNTPKTEGMPENLDGKWWKEHFEATGELVEGGAGAQKRASVVSNSDDPSRRSSVMTGDASKKRKGKMWRDKATRLLVSRRGGRGPGGLETLEAKANEIDDIHNQVLDSKRPWLRGKPLFDGPYDIPKWELEAQRKAADTVWRSTHSASEIADTLVTAKKKSDAEHTKMLERLNVRRQAKEAAMMGDAENRRAKDGRDVPKQTKSVGDELKAASRIQAVMAYLQELRLFRFVHFEVTYAVAQLLQPDFLLAGDPIVTGEDTNDALYIVEEGNVVFHPHLPPQEEDTDPPEPEEIEEISVAHYGPGSHFGRLLRKGDQIMPWTWSVSAVTESKVLVLSRISMRRLPEKHFDALEIALRMECLRNVPQLQRLPLEKKETVIESLVSKLSVRHYESGQYIVKFETKAAEFFVVYEGNAAASLTLPWGTEAVVRTMATYEPGEMFGELAVLTGTSRYCNVKACTGDIKTRGRTTCLVMTGDDFTALDPTVLKLIKDYCREKYSPWGLPLEMTSSSPVLSIPDISMKEYFAFTRRMRPVTWAPGQTVIQYGGLGDYDGSSDEDSDAEIDDKVRDRGALYFVASGILQAIAPAMVCTEHSGGLRTRELKEVNLAKIEVGDVFGEITCVDPAQPRSATVKAVGKATGYAVYREDLNKFAPECVTAILRSFQGDYSWYGHDNNFLRMCFDGVEDRVLWQVAKYASVESYQAPTEKKESKKKKKEYDFEIQEKSLMVKALAGNVPKEEEAVYFVQEGEVQLSLLATGEHKQPHPIRIRKLGHGGCFNVSSMMPDEGGIHADASALTNCKVLRLARPGYQLLPDEMRARIRLASIGKNKRQILPALRPVACLQEVPEVCVWAMCELLKRVPLEEGEKLFEAGELGLGWYIVTQGKLAVTRDGNQIHAMGSRSERIEAGETELDEEYPEEPTEEEIEVASREAFLALPDSTVSYEGVGGKFVNKDWLVTTLETGDTFGEAEMLRDVPCLSTVVALEASEAYLVPYSSWKQLPPIIKAAMGPNVDHFIDRMKATSDAILAEVTEAERKRTEQLRELSNLLAEGSQDEDLLLAVIVHARTCKRRCPLGKHCDAAKTKIKQLVDHKARCKLADKSSCQRCSLLEVAQITEEEAFEKLAASKDKTPGMDDMDPALFIGGGAPSANSKHHLLANLNFSKDGILDDGIIQSPQEHSLIEDDEAAPVIVPTKGGRKRSAATPPTAKKAAKDSDNPFSFREGPNDQLSSTVAAAAAAEDAAAAKAAKRKESNASSRGEPFAVTDEALNTKLHEKTDAALAKRASIASLNEEDVEDLWLAQVGAGEETSTSATFTAMNPASQEVDTMAFGF